MNCHQPYYAPSLINPRGCQARWHRHRHPQCCDRRANFAGGGGSCIEYMISAEHLQAEPYNYRTEPNTPYSAHKIIVLYRTEGMFGLRSIVLSASQTEPEEKCTVRYGTIRLAHSVHPDNAKCAYPLYGHLLSNSTRISLTSEHASNRSWARD